MVLDSSNKGDECTSAHTFCKDLPLTRRIVAKELAHHEMEANSLPSTGDILEPPLVVAMD